jgi:hypothetical protein
MALRKNKTGLYTALFFLCASFLVANSAHAATLQINSSSVTLSPGSIATLSIVLNSEGVAINNSEAKIIFPSDLLEVVSISKANSIFSLWVEEPAYSNVSGTISFNGGVPTPGFNGSTGTAVSIVVKAKKAGQADIIFSDAAVRANDGFGTDVLRVKTGKTLSVIQKDESTVSDQSIVPGPSTMTLQVTSPTHPSQELWYRNGSPTFAWKVPTGVDAIQTGIDNHTSGSPRVVFSPAISERTVKDQEDGIWYFKVRARKNGEWGPVSTYIARIDNTIPQKNEVVFSYDDDKKVLNIKADIIDETSGLDHYEIFINDVLVEKVLATEFVNGNYELTYKTAGNNLLKLVAVDRAGNSIESLGSFKATAVQEPTSVPVPSKHSLISMGSFAIPVIYFIIALLSVITILVLGAFKLGRHYSKFSHKFKVRTSLAKGDHSKVLLVLKKRLEKHLEILQRIRQDRILSKEEKEIKEAIEGDLDEVDKAIEEQKEQ